jgi:N-acetylglucosamine kinase-like BadF-type ATPase
MIAVLAVDGGQSGIRMRHSDSTRVVEVDGVTRSADTVAAVATAVSEAWAAGGFAPVERVMLGLTTAPGFESDADRLCGLVATVTGAREIWLADDTVTAHSGALAGEPGVCLVAGTGVACLAVGPQGEPRSFDGHGYLLGDEGGAFWIGRRALRLALRDHDRRLGGSLIELAQARFGTVDGLHIRLHEAKAPVNEIAQFARDVLDAAHSDKAADQVIDEAARRLLSTALDAVDTIHEPTVALALGGRLLENGTALRNKLDALLAGHEKVRPQSALGTPLDGALRLGGLNSPGQYSGLVHVWKEERAA